MPVFWSLNNKLTVLYALTLDEKGWQHFVLQSNLYIVNDVVNTVVRSVQNICAILWFALLLY